MKILWTDEVLDDLAEIIACYCTKASPRTAESVERRINQRPDPGRSCSRPTASEQGGCGT